MKVLFGENNSGGYWRLTPDDYQELERSGWNVTLRPYDAGGGAWAFCDSEEQAYESFERATGWDRVAGDDCPCCGDAFSFFFDDEDGVTTIVDVIETTARVKDRLALPAGG